ncbi:MAG: YjjG family noncanonical pyrimidine nucleotidase [Bacteroidota bacterium]|nr:YjjG family noncanonical pyrimidine nucleotidase [Bacteroidota bacterium]
MKQYKAVFFDLDHTLWDFELNSQSAIAELYHEHKLESLGITGLHDFIAAYRDINKKMWDEYHRNTISKETLRAGRFSRTLESFGISNLKLAEQLAAGYITACPVKTNLFPGTMEILEYLSEKYSLHIITNGFKEVQHLKIRNSGIAHFFEHIHISEEIGFKKPEPEIFNYAVKQSRAVHEQCVMIGDNLDTDIAGAENAGIDPVFFNPLKIRNDRQVFYEIHQLAELRNIL